MVGLVRGSVMLVVAIVVGTIFAVNVVMEGVADLLARSNAGG